MPVSEHLLGIYQTNRDNMLFCGICNQKFCEQVILACRHTFCKPCLLAVVSSSLPVKNDSCPSLLKCPACKPQVLEQTSEDIERLKNDFFH